MNKKRKKKRYRGEGRNKGGNERREKEWRK